MYDGLLSANVVIVIGKFSSRFVNGRGYIGLISTKATRDWLRTGQPWFDYRQVRNFSLTCDP
jgi:hypothetical protein